MHLLQHAMALTRCSSLFNGEPMSHAPQPILFLCLHPVQSGS